MAIWQRAWRLPAGVHGLGVKMAPYGVTLLFRTVAVASKTPVPPITLQWMPVVHLLFSPTRVVPCLGWVTSRPCPSCPRSTGGGAAISCARVLLWCLCALEPINSRSPLGKSVADASAVSADPCSIDTVVIMAAITVSFLVLTSSRISSTYRGGWTAHPQSKQHQCCHPLL